MKTVFKLLLLAILLAGWGLASSSLYLVRGPGKLAGIPKTEWAGRWALITKDCLGFRDTYVDTSKWTVDDLARHPVVAQRIRESGKKYLISHITETGLVEAVKPVQVGSVAEKHQDSIFDFPEKK
jgi:hypothetical protein